MSWTTVQLLDNLKVRGAISSTGAMFTTARLLAMATNEMRSYLVPKVLKARENYYTWDEDTAINATGVYQIHTRALAGKLDNIALVDATPTATRRQDLSLLSEDELEDYGATPQGSKPGVFLKRNTMQLVPATGTGWSYFRQTFFLRPGDFIETDAAAQITAINTSTKVCTCSTVPSTWATSNVFDFVQDQPHFDTLQISKAISAIVTGAAGTLTFSAALDSRLAVGDWITLAGQTVIVQAPEAWHPILEQRVANICLQSMGRTEALKNGESTLKDMLATVTSLVAPRVEREPKRLVNRSGMLRRG